VKTERHKEGFLSLSRQAAAIFACGSAIWCLIMEVTILEALFRAAVVYLSITILSYIVSNLVAGTIKDDETLEIVSSSDDGKNERAR